MDQSFDATVNLRVKSCIMGFFGIAAMICFSLGYKKTFAAMLGIVCLYFVSILVNRTRYVRYVDAVLTILMTVIISGLFLHGRELAPMSFFFVLIMAVAGLLILGTRLGSILAVYYIILTWAVCWTPFLPETRSLYGIIFLRRIPFMLIGFIGIAYIICYKVRSYDQKHKQYKEQLEARIKIEKDKLGDMSIHLVTTMFHAESAKSPEVTIHSQQVAKISQKIAKKMGKTAFEQDRIYYAGLLHDVGKMQIRDLKLELDEDDKRVLKEEDLKAKDNSEEGIYQFHAEKGSIFMKHLQLPEEITDAALYHHENYDGSGFPYGLKREQIPESARIVAVANLIVNRRSKNEPVWKIVSYLESMDGIHFDPLVVNAAIEVLYSV